MTQKRKSRTDIENGGVDNKGFKLTNEALSPSKPRSLSVMSTTSIVSDGGQQVLGRQSWDNPIEFILSCISFSVGLGNIWRFPFTAYKNGGGAFLIPYIIVLLIIGRPVYFLEITIGQFASFGSVKVWKCSPFFKGIGYIGLFTCIVTLSYYCSIIATTIYYFVMSFQATLPWSECSPNWDNCTNCSVSNCPQLYFDEVTQQKTSIDDGIGWPIWELTLGLVATWVLIFLSLMKGVQSSGKVAYFTAIFPYVVLFIFLVRGVTLEGSDVGMKYFVTPQWDKIGDPDVWYAALGQCFFSLGTGTGTITMFSSYNPFRHAAYRDALIISVMDLFTSLLAGLTIFAVLGHLSFLSGIPIERVTEGGPGLVFVSYPSAISNFTWAPQLFAVLFFLMLLTLGIGSANAFCGVPVAILLDQFPRSKKWQVALLTCGIGFLLSLIFVTPGGQFMVTFVDYYGGGFLLYFACMIEIITIAWVYGLRNYIRDLEFMLGIRLGLYWVVCWGFVIPVGLLVVLIYTFATAKPLVHNGVEFPLSATIIGWGLALFAVLMLPSWGLHSVSRMEGRTFKERLLKSFTPKKTWGPRLPNYRKGWDVFKKLGELKYRIPISDTETLTLYIRGVKERILITPDKNSVTLRIYAVRSDADVRYWKEPNRLIGVIHKILRMNRLKWIIKEKACEIFRIRVDSSIHAIKDVHMQRMYNHDYVITLTF